MERLTRCAIDEPVTADLDCTYARHRPGWREDLRDDQSPLQMSQSAALEVTTPSEM